MWRQVERGENRVVRRGVERKEWREVWRRCGESYGMRVVERDM